MKSYLYSFALAFVLISCNSVPKGLYVGSSNEGLPDYSKLENWAASPLKEDPADRTPGSSFVNAQDDAEVDVFFLHPTTYTKERGNDKWNADLNDEDLNEKTDNGTILFQSSAFNGAGRIYAPRYRQAHIQAFYDKKQERRSAGQQALNFAYKDVKLAFEYYMENHNDGRPIIVAGHSQGTLHAGRLIKDYFEGKPLEKKLVAAYLVGMPVRDDYFESIPACEDADDTNCFVTWRSYQRDFLPKWHEKNSNIVVTNPLSWKLDNEMVDKTENKGTVLFKFEDGVYPGLADAQVYEDHLWVNKPKFKGSIFMRFKNYHIADYNLFYVSIRENAIERSKAYLESH